MTTTYTDTKGTTWTINRWFDEETQRDWWCADNLMHAGNTYEELVDAIEYWGDYTGPTYY